MYAPLLEFPLSGSGLILFLSYLFAHLDKFIYSQSLQLSVATTYSRVGFIHELLMKELKDKLRGCKMYHFFTTGKKKKKKLLSVNVPEHWRRRQLRGRCLGSET